MTRWLNRVFRRRSAILRHCGASSYDRRDVRRLPSGVVSYTLARHQPLGGVEWPNGPARGCASGRGGGR
jgi:hypothetical protein